MHGLINIAIQGFVTDTYGAEAWARVLRMASTGVEEFEPLGQYDDAVALRLLWTAERVLDKPYTRILEDIGTWLVASRQPPTIRRLLRFGGMDFEDFLHSLDDLPGRVRMAVSDLVLPAIEVKEVKRHSFSIRLGGPTGFGHVLLGLLQAMADDYGALAVIDHAGLGLAGDRLTVRVVRRHFSAGRAFRLGAAAG